MLGAAEWPLDAACLLQGAELVAEEPRSMLGARRVEMKQAHAVTNLLGSSRRPEGGQQRGSIKRAPKTRSTPQPLCP
jgi:hypothetical protein